MKQALRHMRWAQQAGERAGRRGDSMFRAMLDSHAFGRAAGAYLRGHRRATLTTQG